MLTDPFLTPILTPLKRGSANVCDSSLLLVFPSPSVAALWLNSEPWSKSTPSAGLDTLKERHLETRESLFTACWRVVENYSSLHNPWKVILSYTCRRLFRLAEILAQDSSCLDERNAWIHSSVHRPDDKKKKRRKVRRKGWEQESSSFIHRLFRSDYRCDLRSLSLGLLGIRNERVIEKMAFACAVPASLPPSLFPQWLLITPFLLVKMWVLPHQRNAGNGSAYQ